MDDKAFEALKLRASLCPHREEWPDENLHWQILGKSVDSVRERVSTAYDLMSAVDQDANLSSEGRRNQKAQIAQEAIAGLKTIDGDLERARDVVSSVQDKIDEAIKKPTDAAEATLHREIRDRFSKLQDASARINFLQRFGSDAQIASALLTAPAGLTDLSDAERALLRSKVEGQVDPEMITARDAMVKAMQEAEEAWTRAEKLLANRGGLQKPSSDAA